MKGQELKYVTGILFEQQTKEGSIAKKKALQEAISILQEFNYFFGYESPNEHKWTKKEMQRIDDAIRTADDYRKEVENKNRENGNTEN